MADNPDTPEQGRMLFTDMDIQDKGRPAAAILDDDGREAALPHLVTLDDIAANIGLDFLDDDEDISSGMPGTTSASTAESFNHTKDTPAAPAKVHSEGDDDILSLDDVPAATVGGNLNGAPGEVLTWESFASAFRHEDGQGQVAHVDQPTLHTGLPVPLEEFFNPRPTEATTNDVSGTVFSEAFGVDGSHGEGIFPTDSVDELLDDDDADILSILMPPVGANSPDTQDAARRRPAVTVPPPPPVPYGGLERVEDWYVPPEEEDRVFTMPTDWYEPPEEIRDGLVGDAATTPVSDAASPAQRQSTRRRGRDVQGETTKRRPASHDTTGALDLFSDFNLDEVWEERVKSSPDKSPDTRSLDLFNGLDIEELWEHRSPSHTVETLDMSGGIDLEGLQARYGDLAASDTLILDTGQNDAASTVILPSDQLEASRPGHNDTARFTQPNDQDEAAELLAELDSFGEESDDAADDETPQAGVPQVRSTRGEGDDPIDLGEYDFDDAEGSDDADAPEGARQPRRRKPRRSSGDDITIGDPRRGYGPRRDGSESADESPRPRRRSAKPLFDNDSPDPTMVSGTAGDDEEQDDDATVDQLPDVSEAEDTGLTADDLLEEGFDDIPGIDADLSAPVIDDSAITSTKGPRPGTEEMQAIMAQHEAEGEADMDGEPQAGLAEGSGEAEGGEGGDEEEDDTPVALNPMDVFANMDDMDFSDDMDDEMRAMLDDEEAEAEGGEGDPEGAAEAAPLLPPDGFIGKVSFTLGRVARRYLPDGFLERLQQMVAWRENWWFYCDLVAAIIASASLAIIISYYIWYRN